MTWTWSWCRLAAVASSPASPSRLKSSRPAVRVVGAEPALAGDLAEGYATGERAVWSRVLTGRTIADGLRAAAVGELP